MKQTIFVILLGFCLGLTVASPAQSDSQDDYRNFPLVLSIQFQNLALPFQDISSSFSNIGIGIGTEISLNGNHNWGQEFSLVWYRNKAIGNGLLIYTQSAWRPSISNAFAELKLGAGYLFADHPVESYKFDGDGWILEGKKGKRMFTIPAGISLGYYDYSSNLFASPFASYQFLIMKGYNNTLPIVPATLLQFGSRIHLKND